jgi:hypothetical protein
MQKQNRPLLIAFIITALLLCCLVIILLTGAFTFLRAQSSSEPTSTSPSETPQAGNELNTSLQEIETQVSQLRELTLSNPLPLEVLTPDELANTVREEFFADYSAEEAAQDVHGLSLLGLLPADFDLLNFYQALYAEQIAGYYDNEKQTMFVVSGQEFGGIERSTFAHEYVHALQDGHFGFEENMRYSDEYCDQDSERCAALQALIEGDAVLGESMWLQNFATSQDISDIQNFYNSYQSPVWDSAPTYMQLDQSFAYQQGFEFVQYLYNSGGYAAVNRAFVEEQPLSTEQIMHPSRYPTDRPAQVTLPNLAEALGKDWEAWEEDSLGEWYTYLVLSSAYDSGQRLQSDRASAAAEGWGGDRYMLLTNASSAENAFVLTSVWDTPADAQEAFEGFDAYLSLRFGDRDKLGMYVGDAQFSDLRLSGQGQLTWVVTDSAASLSALQTVLWP